MLEGFNLVVKPGQVVGIVGRTGSGKSTLASLLLRFYAPPAGTVFFDGRDIRELELGTLRRAIGYVPQDAFLFGRSLSDNVDFGPAPRGAENVAEALGIAAIAEEVRELPHAESTILGERGVTLSGGQRQRLSLARALVQEPPVLVLDDCLSAVDAQTEVQILEGLRDYMRGRTTLLIAHRLSIVRHADHIVLLERGRIVEQGTHDALVARGGDYARMWEQQQLELALEAVQ
ncbi:MAG: ATP-binding cassette domain-containing protein [Candidatus Sericytochromatia bacterium]|uniref:ATP-binding cassette domain-containing protein n=1 Tax=Candidatus Tanganyikabacteria bacterium TaxID=2961651 RepID=A0A937X6Y4_9BACT|nr:ATP-binding cassette domain-containing protein [Candidatus Tanganyikabacteria bacterium]